MRLRLGIVGAGWAGLALADELADSPYHVSIYEAAPILGGRARNAEITIGERRVQVDNGQHLLIAAYARTLALASELHRAPLPLRRLPLQFESQSFGFRRQGPGHFGLMIGLARLRGAGQGGRLALCRFGAMLAWRGWQGFDQQTVTELLASSRQPNELVQHFWRPFCLAALNTPPDSACAQTFVNVVHDALVADPTGSDFLIPSIQLGDLLAAPLEKRLRANNTRVYKPWPVRELRGQGTTWAITSSRNEVHELDAVVLATGTHAAARLLAPVAPDAARALGRHSYHGIKTAYLGWPAPGPAAIPTIRMLDDRAPEQPGQWLFDRGVQAGMRLASVVISASDTLQNADPDCLKHALVEQLRQQLGLPAPLGQSWISEKRATFACTPHRPKAGPRSVDSAVLPKRLFLAGDYCWPRYPATLESALLSARATAQAIRSTVSAQ